MSEQRQYRGIRKDNGEWVYGWPLPRTGGREHVVIATQEQLNDDRLSVWEQDEDLQIVNVDTECHEVIPSTVGQATGKEAIDGKDIYEGDRIGFTLVDLSTKKEQIGVVYYSEKRASFCVKNKAWDCVLSFVTINEVIGHIHEDK